MRTRARLLVMSLGIVLTVVACGRATEEEINQALGITPTPTMSAEEIATSTAEAVAAAATRTAVAAGGGQVGDVTQGEQQFRFQCAGCHRPAGGGQGPVLAGPDSPAAPMTDEQLVALVREGVNADGSPHQPGIYGPTIISNSQLTNIIAYLRAQAGQ